MHGLTKLRLSILISLVVVLMTISACSSPGGPRERSGRNIGAVVGQVIGVASGSNYPVARALSGAAIGSYIGGRVGRSMDNRDRQRAYYALEHSRDNRPTTWTNDSSRYRYVFTPARRNRGHNVNCREYASESYVQGRRLVYYGYACRDSSGYWRDVRR